MSAVAALAAGCGSTSAYSVRDVERAFFVAGIPFAVESQVNVPPNPYLRPKSGDLSYALPRPVAAGLLPHVEAILVVVNSTTFTGQWAFVFDSASSVDAALLVAPLSKWLPGDSPTMRVRLANVIVVAAPAGDAAWTRKIRRALAILRQRQRE